MAAESTVAKDQQQQDDDCPHRGHPFDYHACEAICRNCGIKFTCDE